MHGLRINRPQYSNAVKALNAKIDNTVVLIGNATILKAIRSITIAFFLNEVCYFKSFVLQNTYVLSAVNKFDSAKPTNCLKYCEHK